MADKLILYNCLFVFGDLNYFGVYGIQIFISLSFSCVSGDLVEVNERLQENVHLLKTKVLT